MEDCADNPEDGQSCVETESNCSYEETAAKIEMVLRRNLRMDMVDANDDKQLTRTTVGMSVRPSCRPRPKYLVGFSMTTTLGRRGGVGFTRSFRGIANTYSQTQTSGNWNIYLLAALADIILMIAYPCRPRFQPYRPTVAKSRPIAHKQDDLQGTLVLRIGLIGPATFIYYLPHSYSI